MANKGIKELTDILYFDRQANKRLKRRECEIISNFLLCKNDFFIVEKGGYYFICLSHSGELISLWYHKVIENGEKMPPSEAVSIFRKKYIGENITQERLGLFVDNPLEYESKFPKQSK